jgi:hypothetical protein
MPDLDLIKQGNQGCGWFGEADPSISAGRRRLQPKRAILLLICCRSSKRPDGSSTNGCSQPRLPGVGPTTIQILPGCLVVGDTAERARSGSCSTASRTPTAASHRCRSHSATTPPASTSTARCRRSPRATPARAAASGLSNAPGATISLSANWRRSPAATAASRWSAGRR